MDEDFVLTRLQQIPRRQEQELASGRWYGTCEGITTAVVFVCTSLLTGDGLADVLTGYVRAIVGGLGVVSTALSALFAKIQKGAKEEFERLGGEEQKLLTTLQSLREQSPG